MDELKATVREQSEATKRLLVVSERQAATLDHHGEVLDRQAATLDRQTESIDRQVQTTDRLARIVEMLVQR